MRDTAAAHGLDNLEFIDGRFEQTAEPALDRCGPVALAHIDSDVYSAIVAAYDAVKPHMVTGGYYVFDDATVASCLAETEAVEELVVRRDGMHAEKTLSAIRVSRRLG